MEMLKKKKNNSEYEIDRELTGKFAIEKNAEYQDRIAELEEENKSMKEDLENAKPIMEMAQQRMEENKKLREEKAEIQKIGESWRQECKQLRERINTMQEFIDYSEGVVQNAIGMLYEEGGEDKALDYLENCYATGDDKQYEEMERLYKDED